MSGLKQILQNRLQFAGGIIQIDSAGGVNLTPLSGQTNKITGIIALQDSVSQIIPGGTSFSIRNHATSRDNFIVLDAGTATLFGQLSVPSITGAAGLNIITLSSGSNMTFLNGVAGKGFIFSGTQAATSVGTFWTVTAPNGNNAGANGGTGGSFSETAGTGGDAGTGSGGAGGLFLRVAGNGGSTAVAGNSGAAGGYFKYTAGNGGNHTAITGTGDAGSAGLNTSSITWTNINNFSSFYLIGGTGGNTSSSDTGSTAGHGGGFLGVMGDAGTVLSSDYHDYKKGGDYVIVLGTGNAPQVSDTNAFGNTATGRNGEFRVYAPWLTDSTPYELSTTTGPVVTISSYGIGIGSAPNLGTPLNLVWNDVDPGHNINGLSSNGSITLSVDLADTWAMQNQASGVHLFGPGAMTNSSGNGNTDDEFHVYSTSNGTGGPTHAYIRGTYSKVHLENYSADTHAAGFGPGVGYTNTPTPANLTRGYGGVAEVVHEGTGTIAEAVGYLGSLVMQKAGHPDSNGNTSPNQGTNDGLITEASAFKSKINFSGILTGTNRSIITSCYDFNAPNTSLVGYGGTGTAVILTKFAFRGDVQYNTTGATTNDATLTLIAGGSKLTVGQQSATAGATITNYGLYITGNGGNFSGGAHGNNWALYSDSTCASQLAGILMLSASTIARATLNIPHGTAPTSPVNGDAWTTTAGLYIRINGATIGPLS